MIYTVGRTLGYLRAIIGGEAVGRPPVKLGRRRIAREEAFVGSSYYMKPFSGGSVWATRADAQAYLDSRDLDQFAVFGVDASWDQTAEPWADPVGGWRDLLVDAPVIRLDPAYYKKRLRDEALTRQHGTSLDSGAASANDARHPATILPTILPE